MVKQKSYSRIEHNVRHNFRNNLNISDSTEDVRKFFVYAVQDFIDEAFESRVIVNFDDVLLDEHSKEGFVLGAALRNNKEFIKAYEHSDMPQIIARFAESAVNHLRHLAEKHPDKTEAKMFPKPDHSGHFYRNAPVKKGSR